MTDVMKENLLAEKEVSRKSFIKGGSALVIGMSVAGMSGKAQALTDLNNPNPGHRGTGVLGSNANVDWWLQFNTDNTCTLYDNGTEVGNGTPSGAAALTAEELNMTLAQMRLAPLDSNNVGGLSQRVGSGGTNGLAGATAGGRTSGAAAKKLLMNMAAKKWGVDVSTLSVNWGIIKSQDGRKISYADLIGGRIFGYAAAGGVTPDVLAANPTFTGTIASVGATVKAITTPASYLPSAGENQVKVLATRLGRLSIPDIVSGNFTYNHNVRVPGMLHGRVVRPRGQGHSTQTMKVLQIDTTSVAHIPNVQVVREGVGFVGVVAPHEYDAIQAAAQLKVTWDNTPKLGSMINGKFVGGTANWGVMLRNNPIVHNSAKVDFTNVNIALANSAATVSGTFLAHHQQHAPFGPNVAIVDVATNDKPKGATAWMYSQGSSGGSVGTVTANSGLAAAQVRLITLPGSGTYGHSQYDDVGTAATIMSKHVGAPVRVQLMRWDETGWDFTGPAFMLDFVAGVNAAGKISAYKSAAWAPSSGSGEPSAQAVSGTGNAAATGGGASGNATLGFYVAPAGGAASKVTRTMQNDQRFRESYLRAPGEPQAFFAGEQTVDMLAYAAKMDPIAFRKLNLAATSQDLPLLTKLAEVMDWKPGVAARNLGKGNIVTGRGVALGNAPGGGFVVGGADIEVNKKTGKITAKRLYTVQDNGLSVSLGNVENQMVGCMVQGASRGLHELTATSTSRQTAVDWVTYPILRFKDTPLVTTVSMPNISGTHGAGEPGVVPAPAAIANAFFDATGVRAFQLPMSAPYIRSVLQAAAKGLTPPPFGMSSGTTLDSPAFISNTA